MNEKDYRWLLAYAMLIALGMLVAKTRLGYNAIYYSLALYCIMIVLVHYKFIADTLSPIGSSAYVGIASGYTDKTHAEGK